MSRQVRLVVGEGDHKTEVGIANINPIPNGDSMVDIVITDVKFAMLLGGNKLNGIISRAIIQSPELEDETQEETHE